MVGGRPLYVMPLVFGGAPLVNVLVSMLLHPPRISPSPLLYVGVSGHRARRRDGAVFQTAGVKL